MGKNNDNCDIRAGALTDLPYSATVYGEGTLHFKTPATLTRIPFYLMVGTPRSAFDMLRYPKVDAIDLKCVIPELSTVDPSILTRLEIDGALSRKFDLSSRCPRRA